jgi:beta-lactamase regulating signal transducer with metallopeptidase domain
MGDWLQTFSWPDSIRFGWALIHFLWQGVFIAIVLETALACVGQKNAALRYFFCELALAAMPLCLLATYGVLDRGTSLTFEARTSLAIGSSTHASSPITAPGYVLQPVVETITPYIPREFSMLEPNRFMPGIVAGWLVGVVLLSGRKAGGFIVLWRLRRRGVSEPDDAMQELFRKACARIGVDPRRVILRISTLIQVPMTMGWINPIVLFPAALLSRLSTGEIELILAHELAHIRRHDYLVNLLQTVVETLFFYHPFTWWISKRMRQERENSCDDLVASGSPDALAYAKVLLRLQTLGTPDQILAPTATGGILLQRIRRLLEEPAPRTSMGLPTLLVLLSIIAAVVGTTSMVKAQETAVKKAPDSIPLAKAAPPTPEAVFAQPITVKEMNPLPNSPSITRLYYQGGDLILQQTVNMSPGSMGQLVFYKGVNVVDDRVGTLPPHVFSSREILPNDFKVRVQSISADNVSPATLRILDSKDQIITEFFIDPTGLMRPITKAEHDADLARRKAAFSVAPPVKNPGTSTDAGKRPDETAADSFIATPPDPSGQATLGKLKSITIDKVAFDKEDVATILQFFADKSKELDPDKKGIAFVLGDLSHITPQDHVHREVTLALENVPLIDLLGYVCSQTNLKCSIEGNTVYFKPPTATTSTAPANEANPGVVTILNASYEAKDGTAARDVTDIVTKMLTDNRLSVLADNDVFGGDPAWLHAKQLRVDYTMDGEKRETIADEGTTLSIPPQAKAPTQQQNRGNPSALPPAGSFGQLFGQLGKVMDAQAKVMADGATNLAITTLTNAPNMAPAAQPNDDKAAKDKNDADLFALPPEGSFGQLGQVMEIHATFSRELKPGIPAVHYYSQYRGLGTGMEGGVSWGGEIAVYGIPSPFAEGSTWKGIVYPAGHMTFGWDRLSVYATTKEQALALMDSESEKDRKSFPP